MIFTYRPEGAEAREYPFEPNRLMSPEAEAIERVTGVTFAKWQELILEGSMLCTRAFLWVMLKRSEPTLKFDQVMLSMSEVGFRYTAEEKDQIREHLTAKAETEGLDDEERELLESVTDEVEDVPLDAPSEPTSPESGASS